LFSTEGVGSRTSGFGEAPKRVKRCLEDVTKLVTGTFLVRLFREPPQLMSPHWQSPFPVEKAGAWFRRSRGRGDVTAFSTGNHHALSRLGKAAVTFAANFSTPHQHHLLLPSLSGCSIRNILAHRIGSDNVTHSPPGKPAAAPVLSSIFNRKSRSTCS
jgi:hypothetical protein